MGKGDSTHRDIVSGIISMFHLYYTCHTQCPFWHFSTNLAKKKSTTETKKKKKKCTAAIKDEEIVVSAENDEWMDTLRLTLDQLLTSYESRVFLV